MNEPMKKKITTIVASLFLVGALQAQDGGKKHELSLYGLGGLSSLQFKTDAESSKLGFGGGGGLSYAYTVNSEWSVKAGAEVSLLSGKVSVPNLDALTPSFSDGVETYDLIRNYVGYEDKLSATYLSIPVQAQYKFLVAGVNAYAAAGLKIGFALSGKSTLAADSNDFYAVFPNFDPFHDIDAHGLKKGPNFTDSRTLSLGLNVALAAEVGARFALTEQYALTTGLFCDYGVTNIAPEELKPNTTTMNTLSVGLKVGFVFGF
ncbi:hypothetical protein FACS1894199_12470 [Bacteroidia bacterium]|nr:hypothetical protein FACS1894199_12470 [Bacteroidia bacterium]